MPDKDRIPLGAEPVTTHLTTLRGDEELIVSVPANQGEWWILYREPEVTAFAAARSTQRAVWLGALLVAVVRQRRRFDEGAGRDLSEQARFTIAVLIAQVFLGAVNVWAGEHAWLIVAHLAVGTILWVSLVRFAFTLASVPEATAAAARGRTPAKAAPA